MIREACGTMHGLLAHQAAGEKPCGWCVHAEQVARITAEGIPSRPTPPGWLPPVTASEQTALEPVTADEARQNAALLRREVLAAEASVTYRRRVLAAEAGDAATQSVIPLRPEDAPPATDHPDRRAS